MERLTMLMVTIQPNKNRPSAHDRSGGLIYDYLLRAKQNHFITPPYRGKSTEEQSLETKRHHTFTG